MHKAVPKCPTRLRSDRINLIQQKKRSFFHKNYQIPLFQTIFRSFAPATELYRKLKSNGAFISFTSASHQSADMGL